jgi:hypothetical protein
MGEREDDGESLFIFIFIRQEHANNIILKKFYFIKNDYMIIKDFKQQESRKIFIMKNTTIFFQSVKGKWNSEE